VLLFFEARPDDPGITRPKTIAGALFHLAALIAAGLNAAFSALSGFVNISGCVFLVCLLFNLNNLSLYAAVLSDPSERSLPSHLRRPNVLMLTVFVLLAFLTAGFKEVRRIAREAFKIVVLLILRLIAWFSSLFSVTGAGDISGQGRFPSSRNTADPAPFWEKLAAAAALILAAALIVWGLYRLIRRLPHRLRGLLALLKRLFHQEAGAGYRDEAENLLSWELVRARAENGLRSLSRILRPERFEDQPDDLARVRFTYRRLAESLLKTRPDVAYMTPDELLDKMGDDAKPGRALLVGFIGLYKLARYSDRPLPPQAGETAKQVYKSL
jgi:hypothetical protein